LLSNIKSWKLLLDILREVTYDCKPHMIIGAFLQELSGDARLEVKEFRAELSLKTIKPSQPLSYCTQTNRSSIS
jgi:hypothetical protein